MKKNVAIALSALVLAGASGFLASTALSGAQQQPVTTTTITLKNGATGPAGPTGPQGPPGTGGAENCPAGSKFGELVINHPGGQVTILTCIKG